LHCNLNPDTELYRLYSLSDLSDIDLIFMTYL